MVQGNNVQKEFSDFVEKCVMGDGNLLTTTNNLFTDANIKTARDFLRAIKPLFDDKNEKAGKANEQANKKVAKTWGIGDIFDGSVFGDAFEGLDNVYKGNDNKKIIIEILLHCNWLMYLCSDRQHKQNKAKQYKDDKDIAKYFNVATEWAIGATFSSTSLDAMLFILELILEVRNPKNERQDLETYIKKIENQCNEDNWKKKLEWSDNNAISTDAIVNVILFFCNTEKYLPIPAQNNKESIYKKLGGLVKEEYFVVRDGKGKILDVFENEADANNKANEYKQNNQQEAFATIKISELLKGLSDIDKDLYKIRIKLRDGHRYEGKNPFWNHSIRPFWDDSTENLDKDQLSDRTLLEYKKAMILYGPPGTSKSYQARKMAEGMIAEALRNQNNDISNAIDQLQTTIDSHIHILQMHPNYTYDDFIIGKSIGEKGKIIVKPGKMLQIIKGIKQDNIPHFVILDEINRVDISRVFGELFTAMEASYRDKGVELSVDINDIPKVEKDELENNNLIKDGKLYLKVPENMYFIGTMNMIDFSLEQVDFALRRRFLWRLSTYDPKRLDEIISEKVEKEIAEIQKNSTQTKELNTMIGILRSCPDNFSKTCTDLNNEIEWENSLGKSYLIGHAFFSEIVDIVKQVKHWGKAKNILWQVSILPTLEAYCGTMDANMQETFLGNCKKAFFPEPK